MSGSVFQDCSFEKAMLVLNYADGVTERWESISHSTPSVRSSLCEFPNGWLKVEVGCRLTPTPTPTPTPAQEDSASFLRVRSQSMPDLTAAARMFDAQSKSKSTVHWSAEEHRLFLSGLAEHGKSWTKIAHVVKSRDATQVASHAQKYYNRLNASEEKKKRRSIHDLVISDITPWTQPEDQLLKETLSDVPRTTELWQTVACYLPGRSASEVEQRAMELGLIAMGKD